MSKYDMFQNAWDRKIGIRIFGGSQPDQYFAGYDFMGSVIWKTDQMEMYCCESIAEARQIIKDLEAADLGSN